jgi:hypothetical protein
MRARRGGGDLRVLARRPSGLHRAAKNARSFLPARGEGPGCAPATGRRGRGRVVWITAAPRTSSSAAATTSTLRDRGGVVRHPAVAFAAHRSARRPCGRGARVLELVKGGFGSPGGASGARPGPYHERAASPSTVEEPARAAPRPPSARSSSPTCAMLRHPRVYNQALARPRSGPRWPRWWRTASSARGAAPRTGTVGEDE